jgi:hypothetical protein
MRPVAIIPLAAALRERRSCPKPHRLIFLRWQNPLNAFRERFTLLWRLFRSNRVEKRRRVRHLSVRHALAGTSIVPIRIRPNLQLSKENSLRAIEVPGY